MSFPNRVRNKHQYLLNKTYMWKEEFKKLDKPYEGIYIDEGIDFIQTEIIEKLIEDAAELQITEGRTLEFRETLKDKWLSPKE